MSENTNSRGIASERSKNDSTKPEKKIDGYIEKTSKQERVNLATPPDLQYNKPSVRPKPKVQRVTNKTKVTDESTSSEDPDDPCLKKKKVEENVEVVQRHGTPGLDPRFQQTNQTLRCFVMYTDFYRCEKILGDGHEACTWFKDVFTSICPNAWISRWDEWREEGRLPWCRERTQGEFPGDRYGV